MRVVVEHTKSCKDTYPALDAVRFLAASLVMIYHLWFWKNGQLPDSDQPGCWFWRFGWIGVEIFFVLSGFVIAASAQGATASQFLIGRVVRLAPTIWICATLTLLAILAFQTGVNDRQLLIDYARTLIMVPVGNHVDIVYWTLTVEISFYALVLVVIWLKNFDTLLKLLIVIGLVSTAYDAVLAFNPWMSSDIPKLTHLILASSKLHTFRLLLLRHGCFFALGALVYVSMKKSGRLVPLLIGILLAGGTLEVWFEAQSQGLALHRDFSLWSPMVAWAIGFVAIAASTVYCPSRQTTAVKVLRFLGLMTFPIYLLHNNYGLAIREGLSRAGIAESTVGALTVVLITSFGVTLYLEPPLARAFRKRLSGSVPHRAPRSAVAQHFS